MVDPIAAQIVRTLKGLSYILVQAADNGAASRPQLVTETTEQLGLLLETVATKIEEEEVSAQALQLLALPHEQQKLAGAIAQHLISRAAFSKDPMLM